MLGDKIRKIQEKNLLGEDWTKERLKY